MVFRIMPLPAHEHREEHVLRPRLARAPNSEIEEKVKRVAGMLNIGLLLERKPAELSGGQRQRVAMGRALVRDASTFLFDEPLSNLDAKLRAKMRTELAEMRDQLDKNMIYVTHDQIEAMTLGDRIVVMSDGHVQQQGTPQDLFERPVNRFVAGFIGTPTMNFLDGEIVSESGRTTVRGQGFDLPLSDATVARLQDGTGNRAVTAGIGHRSSPDRNVGRRSSTVVSEYLGTVSILVTRCGSSEVQVEIPGALDAKPGDQIPVYVSPDDIMLFDRETGRTL